MRFITPRFAVAALLCALAVLVTAETSHAASILQGTVTDRSTGAPLAGVTVGRCGLTVSDGNGNYSLTAQDLCNEGSGTVIFQQTGYFLLSSPYTLTGSPTILDVSLLPGGPLVR
jgi:hypothetical protein